MRTVLLFSVLVLALTGCRTIWDPTFMPAGYKYHHEEYKSPPGPEPHHDEGMQKPTPLDTSHETPYNR